ncbi:MAG TPA: Lrp/AsnC family transcriptional regulator [Salinivirga sp.]|uniref:Leucine-responsive regulatory protein n=1 Tax=Salinivirga cyanobacteriivorans TaxID=1307839 RepID=A0A0S2I569_9BACT|nr:MULTISPECIES: Lrp/AsnC family transcriptional regulator [Salinivirga]ALO17402.1 Leucine-responsive regulatory protein [Salinivirga cyanobacteriivorans]HKK59793.1 Lrp/AsnC family transcriptional regulator [Salinivirga sp.]
MKLDATDRKILAILQENARITTKELASQLHLSNTPVYERVKKLEKAGIIEKYTAKLNASKVGRSMTSFIMVSLQSHTKRVVEEFQKEAMSLPEVMEFYYISGNYDALLKVMVADMSEFKVFLEEKLASVEHITQFHSIFVISGDKKDGFEVMEK